RRPRRRGPDPAEGEGPGGEPGRPPRRGRPAAARRLPGTFAVALMRPRVGVPGWPTVGLRHPFRDRSEAMMGLLDRRRARKRAADRERPAAAAAACRATLAGLREAFGPGSYYRRANTSADTWAD